MDRKKNIRYIATIITLFLLTTLGYGQTGRAQKADKLFNQYLYHDAIYIYEGIKTKDADVTRKLADAYRLISEPSKAEPYYEALYNTGSYTPEDIWNYADVLKMNKKYPEALTKIQQYNTLKPGEKRVQYNLEDTYYYNELMADSNRFAIKQLDFNSTDCEYAPMYYNAEIVFVSSKPLYSFTEHNDNWTDRRFTNLFSAYDGTTKKGKPSLTKIREVIIRGGLSKKFHEGPASFTTDGLTMIFTRNAYVENKQLDTASHERVLELWMSKKDVDGTWRNPVALPYNNLKYNVGHPSISADGHTLYFVSDMPGGYGGTDIWKASMTRDGYFEPPVNMGEKINTEGDEMFPFIHETGLLFFASNGHAGLGGLDIFVTRIAHGTPGGIANLGSSINSSKDDFSLIIDVSLRRGFIASNRDGGKGLDDIYGFDVLQPFVLHKTIQGVVKEKDHGELISGVIVKLFDADGKELADTITDEHGFYHFQAEPDEDYWVSGNKVDYKETKKKTTTRSKGDVVTLDMELELMHTISLECIVTDENNGSPLDSTHIVIFDKSTNAVLYDIYTNADGKWRTVLAPALAYTTINYRISLEKEGFIPKTLDYSHRVNKEEEIKLHEFMDFSLGTMHVGADLGQLLSLNPIYFDKGKFAIRPDAALELDKVVDVMKKYPNFSIELDSHTDCRNSASTNQILSQRRADASVSYIVSKGISAHRIFGVGLGESKPVNGCICEGAQKSTCTEEEHGLNRRTQFLVVEINN